jgi:transposase-like protein
MSRVTGRENFVAEPDDERSGEPLRLTVAAVARRLGIAPATLRTWDRRYGLGPTGHTSGRHRRYGPEDIARLEQMQRALLRGASPAEAARYARSSLVEPSRPQYPESDTGSLDSDESIVGSGVLPDTEGELDVSANTGGRGLRLTGAGPRARGLGRAALALDSWSAQHLLVEAIQADGVLPTWNTVLEPVLRAIDERRWRAGSGIAAYELLTDSAATALRATIATAESPLNPRPVLLASVPGGGEQLALLALSAALASRRVGHRLFGPSLSKEGLDSAVRQLGPAAVVLWSAQPHYASLKLFSGLDQRRRRARLFAVGEGWPVDELPGPVEFLDSLGGAVDRLSSTAAGDVS